MLLRAKFRRWLTEPEARLAVAHIAQLAEHRDDPPPEPGLTPDPKDDYLVALARATGASTSSPAISTSPSWLIRGRRCSRPASCSIGSKRSDSHELAH